MNDSIQPQASGANVVSGMPTGGYTAQQARLQCELARGLDRAARLSFSTRMFINITGQLEFNVDHCHQLRTAINQMVLKHTAQSTGGRGHLVWETHAGTLKEEEAGVRHLFHVSQVCEQVSHLVLNPHDFVHVTGVLRFNVDNQRVIKMELSHMVLTNPESPISPEDVDPDSGSSPTCPATELSKQEPQMSPHLGLMTPRVTLITITPSPPPSSPEMTDKLQMYSLSHPEISVNYKEKQLKMLKFTCTTRVHQHVTPGGSRPVSDEGLMTRSPVSSPAAPRTPPGDAEGPLDWEVEPDPIYDSGISEPSHSDHGLFSPSQPIRQPGTPMEYSRDALVSLTRMPPQPVVTPPHEYGRESCPLKAYGRDNSPLQDNRRALSPIIGCDKGNSPIKECGRAISPHSCSPLQRQRMSCHSEPEHRCTSPLFNSPRRPSSMPSSQGKLLPPNMTEDVTNNQQSGMQLGIRSVMSLEDQAENIPHPLPGPKIMESPCSKDSLHSVGNFHNLSTTSAHSPDPHPSADSPHCSYQSTKSPCFPSPTRARERHSIEGTHLLSLTQNGAHHTMASPHSGSPSRTETHHSNESLYSPSPVQIDSCSSHAPWEGDVENDDYSELPLSPGIPMFINPPPSFSPRPQTTHLPINHCAELSHSSPIQSPLTIAPPQTQTSPETMRKPSTKMHLQIQVDAAMSKSSIDKIHRINSTKIDSVTGTGTKDKELVQHSDGHSRNQGAKNGGYENGVQMEDVCKEQHMECRDESDKGTTSEVIDNMSENNMEPQHGTDTVNGDTFHECNEGIQGNTTSNPVVIKDGLNETDTAADLSKKDQCKVPINANRRLHSTASQRTNSQDVSMQNEDSIQTMDDMQPSSGDVHNDKNDEVAYSPSIPHLLSITPQLIQTGPEITQRPLTRCYLQIQNEAAIAKTSTDKAHGKTSMTTDGTCSETIDTAEVISDGWMDNTETDAECTKDIIIISKGLWDMDSHRKGNQDGMESVNEMTEDSSQTVGGMQTGSNVQAGGSIQSKDSTETDDELMNQNKRNTRDIESTDSETDPEIVLKRRAQSTTIRRGLNCALENPAHNGKRCSMNLYSTPAIHHPQLHQDGHDGEEDVRQYPPSIKHCPRRIKPKYVIDTGGMISEVQKERQTAKLPNDGDSGDDDIELPKIYDPMDVPKLYSSQELIRCPDCSFTTTLVGLYRYHKLKEHSIFRNQFHTHSHMKDSDEHQHTNWSSDDDVIVVPKIDRAKPSQRKCAASTVKYGPTLVSAVDTLKLYHVSFEDKQCKSTSVRSSSENTSVNQNRLFKTCTVKLQRLEKNVIQKHVTTSRATQGPECLSGDSLSDFPKLHRKRVCDSNHEISSQLTISSDVAGNSTHKDHKIINSNRNEANVVRSRKKGNNRKHMVITNQLDCTTEDGEDKISNKQPLPRTVKEKHPTKRHRNCFKISAARKVLSSPNLYDLECSVSSTKTGIPSPPQKISKNNSYESPTNSRLHRSDIFDPLCSKSLNMASESELLFYESYSVPKPAFEDISENIANTIEINTDADTGKDELLILFDEDSMTVAETVIHSTPEVFEQENIAANIRDECKFNNNEDPSKLTFIDTSTANSKLLSNSEKTHSMELQVDSELAMSLSSSAQLVARPQNDTPKIAHSVRESETNATLESNHGHASKAFPTLEEDQVIVAKTLVDFSNQDRKNISNQHRPDTESNIDIQPLKAAHMDNLPVSTSGTNDYCGHEKLPTMVSQNKQNKFETESQLSQDSSLENIPVESMIIAESEMIEANIEEEEHYATKNSRSIPPLEKNKTPSQSGSQTDHTIPLVMPLGQDQIIASDTGKDEDHGIQNCPFILPATKSCDEKKQSPIIVKEDVIGPYIKNGASCKPVSLHAKDTTRKEEATDFESNREPQPLTAPVVHPAGITEFCTTQVVPSNNRNRTKTLTDVESETTPLLIKTPVEEHIVVAKPAVDKPCTTLPVTLNTKKKEKILTHAKTEKERPNAFETVRRLLTTVALTENPSQTELPDGESVKVATSSEEHITDMHQDATSGTSNCMAANSFEGSRILDVDKQKLQDSYQTAIDSAQIVNKNQQLQGNTEEIVKEPIPKSFPVTSKIPVRPHLNDDKIYLGSPSITEPNDHPELPAEGHSPAISEKQLVAAKECANYSMGSDEESTETKHKLYNKIAPDKNVSSPLKHTKFRAGNIVFHFRVREKSIDESPNQAYHDKIRATSAVNNKVSIQETTIKCHSSDTVGRNIESKPAKGSLPGNVLAKIIPDSSELHKGASIGCSGHPGNAQMNGNKAFGRQSRKHGYQHNQLSMAISQEQKKIRQSSNRNMTSIGHSTQPSINLIKPVHDPQGRFCCLSCEFKTYDAKVYISHIKTSHPKRKKYLCNVCSEVYVRYDTFLRHLYKHTKEHDSERHQFKSEHRESMHKKKADRKKLAKSVHPYGLYQNSARGIATFTTATITEQQQQVDNVNINTVDEMIKCCYCTEGNFTSPTALKEHEPTCYSYLRRAKRKSHVQCMICPAAFPDQDSLMLHRDTTHKTEHECPVCGKVYLTAVSLKTHMRMMHKQQLPVPTSSKVRTETGGLEMIDTSSQNRRYHQEEVQREQPASSGVSHQLESKTHSRSCCYVCLSHFNTTKTLRLHILKHNIALKKYMCKKCGRQFLHNSIMSKHMAMTHMEDLYKCRVCSHVCKTVQALLAHKKEHNTQKAICRYCDKKLRSEYHRSKHEAWHEKSNLLKCGMCDASNFVNVTSLVQHKIAYHPKKKVTFQSCSRKSTDFVEKRPLKTTKISLSHQKNGNTSAQESLDMLTDDSSMMTSEIADLLSVLPEEDDDTLASSGMSEMLKNLSTSSMIMFQVHGSEKDCSTAETNSCQQIVAMDVDNPVASSILTCYEKP